MKSIVFFKTSLSSGGAEHQMTLLANFLVDRGYMVTITTFSDTEDHYPLDNRIKRCRLAEGKSKFSKLISIWKYFITVCADVVFGFGIRENSLLIPPLCFRPDVKIVAGERNTTYGKLHLYETLCYKLLYYRANYIVPNSYTQTQYLLKHYNNFQMKIKTIINYTDIDQYKYHPINKDQNSTLIKIGVFCRYSNQKNFHNFIKAIGLLKSRSEHRFVIHWYGHMSFPHDDQRKYFDEGKRLIEDLGLKEIFMLHDKISNVNELIPQFDALCLPSLFEGFSNSISEYISCGRPVLCSNVSDNSLMVHDNENGYLFNPLSIESMCSSFQKFLSISTEELQMMCVESRKVAEELFDKEKFVRSYIDIIES